VLTDFGIAKIVGMTGLTMTGSVTGTPLYMSPEQAQGGAVDGRTDIYSLGVILYEMVAGQVPFDGDTPFSIIMKHVTQEPPPPRQFRPDVPELVQAVVLRALAKRPEERQQRALELAQAFAAAREAAGLERRPDATQVQPVVPVPVVPVPVVPVPADPSAPGAPATWPLPGDALAPSPASAAPTPGIAPPAALVPPPAAAAQAAAAAAAPAAAAPRRRSGATWLIAFSSLMVVVMIGALGLGFLRNRLPGGTAGQPPTAAGVAGTVAAVATQPGAAPSATPAAPAASPTAGGLVGLDTTETPPAPDGAPEGMVAIPAGPFVLGDERGRLDVRPVRSIDLSAFWIDRTEVTNAQFAAFVNATQHVTEAERQGSARNWREPLPGANALGRPQHPAIYISWDDAQAYCAWAGKRLPTNAEWEKAARGDGGLTWPWGNEFDPARLNQRVGEPAGPMPVGSFPSGQSPYGVLDMAGNVWEWGADYYAAAYYLIAPDTDPQGPAEGDERTLRGGGFANSFDAPPLLTIAFRDHAEPAFFDESSGFRCAQTPAQP
jgi:serine/threonine-protein kinase